MSFNASSTITTLRGARQVGRWQGHPISYTTHIGHLHAPGVVYVGEAARLTHNATGEGIYQAMQSGVYAADAVAAMTLGERSWDDAMRGYTRACRRRFAASFIVGHVIRALVRTPLFDGIAVLCNDPRLRRIVGGAVASAFTGSPMMQPPRLRDSQARTAVAWHAPHKLATFAVARTVGLPGATRARGGSGPCVARGGAAPSEVRVAARAAGGVASRFGSSSRRDRDTSLRTVRRLDIPVTLRRPAARPWSPKQGTPSLHDRATRIDDEPKKASPALRA